MEFNWESDFDSVAEFAKLLDEKDYHRYTSWKYCYRVSQAVYSKYKDGKITDFDYDYLALNLGFFLASWGMFRNSNLFYLGYKVHIEPIKFLFNQSVLWENGNIPGPVLKAINQGLIDKYSGKCEGIELTMTDTLFTKILLGLTGRVMAFDRFCKTAMRKLGYNAGLYGKNSGWVKVQRDFLKYEEAFAKYPTCLQKYKPLAVENGVYVESDEECLYPIAKNVDRFMFELGMLYDALGKIKESKDEEQESVSIINSCFERGISLDNTLLQSMIKDLDKDGSLNLAKRVEDMHNSAASK